MSLDVRSVLHVLILVSLRSVHTCSDLCLCIVSLYICSDSCVFVCLYIHVLILVSLMLDLYIHVLIMCLWI